MDETFKISTKLRKIENLHILFWLFKDMSWCMLWKELGIIMILPTILVSIYLIYKTRTQSSEFFHNLAITFWIIANSIWMISEFYGFDNKPLFFNFNGKNFAFIAFMIGVSILLIYYLRIKKKSITCKN